MNCGKNRCESEQFTLHCDFRNWLRVWWWQAMDDCEALRLQFQAPKRRIGRVRDRLCPSG